MTSRGCRIVRAEFWERSCHITPFMKVLLLCFPWPHSPASGHFPFQLAQYAIFLVVFGRNGQMSSCLRRCVTAPTVESFHRLFCFPKLTLSALPRGGLKKLGQAANIIRQRLSLWQRGDFLALQRALPQGARIECEVIQYSVEDSDDTRKLRRHVERMVDEGTLSKSAKALVSNGIWPLTK